MLKRLVVPLDGSPLAEHALPYAAALARILAARVTLLYARWSAVLPDETAPDLDAVARRLRADGVEADTHLCHMPRVEDAGRAILEAASGLEAGLIVMATHGRGGLGRLLYGSVADQVLRQATLPVLLVPPMAERPFPADRPLRILVPLDGSAAAEGILAPLQALVQPSGAELVVLRVVDSIDYVRPHGDDCDPCRRARARGEEPDIEPIRARRYVDEVVGRLRTAGLTAEPQTVIGGAAATIVSVAREQGADLIAMATHGRGGMARLVLGSVATATLRQASVPILLVRPEAVRQRTSDAAGGAEATRQRRAPTLVKEIMHQPVVTVGPDATLEQVARTMLDHGIGGVPIVDADGRLQGIVTESDFCGRECFVPFSAFKLPRVFGQWLPKEGLEAIYQAARAMKARDVMSAPVITASEDETVTELVRRMVERDVKRLPVVRGGTPVGIVTRHDLLRMMAVTAEAVRPAG